MTSRSKQRALLVASGVSLVFAALAGQAPAPAGAAMGTPGDWPTAAANAQRDGWLRGDPYISRDDVARGGFGLQWKLARDTPQGAEARITGMAAMGGRKPITFLSDDAGTVRSIDNDTGFDYWQRRFESPGARTAGCPGGITSGIARATALIPATTGAGKGGGFGPAVRPAYRGMSGQPGEGIASEMMGSSARGNAAAAAQPGGGPARAGGGAGIAGVGNDATPGRVAGAPAGRVGGGGRGAQGLHVIAPDGVLHILGENSGIDVQKPVPYLVAGSNAAGLSVVGNVAYALTASACSSLPNAVWALDLVSDFKAVTSWETKGGAPIGVPAFGSDGTIYVAVGAAPSPSSSGLANAVVALEPRTLKVKGWFTYSAAAFATTPVVMRVKERDVVATATTDGRVFLLDAAALGGADHATPLYASQGYSATAPVGLASWQEQNGTRWLIVSITGRPAASMDVAASNGAVTGGAVLGLRVGDEAGQVTLQPGWISANMVSPWTPIVVNGVVFALASGEFRASGGAPVTAAQRASRSLPAVLYALDPTNGKTLWNSGKTMTAFAGRGQLLSGNSQIHVVTSDRTVYAFGFSMERR